MATLVKVIAKEAFDYSHDNGVSRLRYEPGQMYEVPDAAVKGMVKRGWVEVQNRESAEAALNPDDAERRRIEEEAAANADGDDGESSSGRRRRR